MADQVLCNEEDDGTTQKRHALWLHLVMMFLVVCQVFHLHLASFLTRPIVCGYLSMWELSTDCFCRPLPHSIAPILQFLLSQRCPQTNLSLCLLGCFWTSVWFVGLRSWQAVYGHARLLLYFWACWQQVASSQLDPSVSDRGRREGCRNVIRLIQKSCDVSENEQFGSRIKVG